MRKHLFKLNYEVAILKVIYTLDSTQIQPLFIATQMVLL